MSLTYPWEAKIKMSMQLTATEFDNEREKIKDAIAAAADVSSGRVRIKGSLIKPGGAAEVDMGVDALNKVTAFPRTPWPVCLCKFTEDTP